MVVSDAIKKHKKQIRVATNSTSNVLIEGEKDVANRENLNAKWR